MFVAKCSKLNVSVFLLRDDLKRLFVIEASVTKLQCCEIQYSCILNNIAPLTLKCFKLAIDSFFTLFNVTEFIVSLTLAYDE